MLRRKLSAKELFFVCTQSLAYILAAVPLRFLYKVTIKRQAAYMRTKPGTLIIANHQAHIDPFLILACLSPLEFYSMLPIYFPTTEAVMTSKKFNPRFFPIVSLLGCFSIGATSNQRMQSMFYIRKLLHTNRSIMLFPEGKINTTVDLDDFKKGAVFFLPHATNALFVRIRGISKTTKAQGQLHSSVSFSDLYDDTTKNITSDGVRAILQSL